MSIVWYSGPDRYRSLFASPRTIPPVGKQRSGRRGADFVGGRSGLQWRQHYVLATITSEHAEGGIQYPKSLSVTTPQGIELQQAHFTEKVIKAQSEGMLPYLSSLTSSDSGTSAAPDRCPSQGGSFSCLLLCLSHASTCLVSEVLPHLDSCP